MLAYVNFEALYNKAVAAGDAAAKAMTPPPMTVVGGVPGEAPKVYYEPEGLCGFAWISFPGNTAWGRWAKKNKVARPHYPSGLCVWVSAYNQSVARKEAFAEAFAAVLNEAGIEASAGSRLD
jgi:hypothetical protein